MEKKEIYKPNEFAKLCGVSVKTLQRWDYQGVLKANRTPTNRRFYTPKHYSEFRGLKTKAESTEKIIELFSLNYNKETGEKIFRENKNYSELGWTEEQFNSKLLVGLAYGIGEKIRKSLTNKSWQQEVLKFVIDVMNKTIAGELKGEDFHYED